MKKHSAGFIAAAVLLVFLMTGIAAVLYKAWREEQKVVQEFVPLGKLKYDEAFLKEAEKIPGIQSISGVKEIPVSLKIGAYTAEVTVNVLDFSGFSIKTENPGPLELGSTLVFLVGRDSLKEFCDHNGHFLSENEQEKLLLQYESLDIEYSCPSGESANQGDASAVKWYPCRIGAVLESPSEGIYLSDKQENILTAKAGAFPVSKILLKVKGDGSLQFTNQIELC